LALSFETACLFLLLPPVFKFLLNFNPSLLLFALSFFFFSLLLEKGFFPLFLKPRSLFLLLAKSLLFF
jgi:hypothetical protein